MAQPGEIAVHPSLGARVTFLQTSEETRGELLRAENELSATRRTARVAQPKRSGEPAHRIRAHAGAPHGADVEAGFAIARESSADGRTAPKQLLRMALLADETKEDFCASALPAVGIRRLRRA